MFVGLEGLNSDSRAAVYPQTREPLSAQLRKGVLKICDFGLARHFGE